MPTITYPDLPVVERKQELLDVIGAHQEPGLPEVMTLSNVVQDGKGIGLADAGQGWHTDMSYSNTIAFANVLYALQVPHRDGRPSCRRVRRRDGVRHRTSTARCDGGDLPHARRRRAAPLTARFAASARVS